MNAGLVMAGTAAFPQHDAPVGYVAMLDALHAKSAPGKFVVSPSGYVLASPRALGTAWPGPLSRLGLACAAAAALGGSGDRAGEDGMADGFADGLLTLHCTALRRALAHALGHLAGRTSEGTSLLGRPQIQADLADIALEIQDCEIAAEAGRPPSRPARWACDVRLTDAGRVLLRLLGASSMLVSGPGADLYLAEVAGNVYLQPESLLETGGGNE